MLVLTSFLLKQVLGIRYEKVDPDYKTLGAYYFVNDMENATLNGSLILFNDNVSVAASIGRQHDNLNQQKPKQSNQWVGSANLNAKINPKLSLSGSYSNFTMFTNKLINPFDKINNPQLYEQPQDSINYRQVSQNTTANISYAINENQNLTLSYSFNDVVNKQNNIVRRGGISRFHNAGAAYVLQFPESKLSLSPSFNYTYSIVSREKTQMMGPSFTISKVFFQDKLIKEEGLLSEFAKQHKENIYKVLAEKLPSQQKINIISESLIDFYHKAYLDSE